MAEVKLNNITKVYDNEHLAVNDVSLHVKDKEFVVLVGPSGCGKSSLLRMIAGLEDISNGDLFINGNCMNDVQAKDRDIAMVFQSYALYPHMSIRKNISFPLKMKGLKKESIDKNVDEIAGILQLDDLLDRKPAQLSGGQRQRAALGRAMVRNPQVFLLDEPLSNLDAKLRVSMRAEIVKLHQRLKTTFIYVTHDQTEAMTMGDRIAILRDGRLEQMDTPAKIYDFPANCFVAQFIGSPKMNMYNVKTGKKDSNYTINLNSKEITIHEESLIRFSGSVPDEVILGIRPEDFLLGEGEDSFEVKVDNVEYMGSDTYIYFDLAGVGSVARISGNMKVKLGDVIRLKVNMRKAYYFNVKTEETLIIPLPKDNTKYQI